MIDAFLYSGNLLKSQTHGSLLKNTAVHQPNIPDDGGKLHLLKDILFQVYARRNLNKLYAVICELKYRTFCDIKYRLLHLAA